MGVEWKTEVAAVSLDIEMRERCHLDLKFRNPSDAPPSCTACAIDID
jgi:hypothetical protein